MRCVLGEVMEPKLRDPERIFDRIFSFHGPRRYWDSADHVDGAYALVQPSDAAMAGEKVCHPDRGPGAVWGWFVRTPKGFFFGFERSKSWASRRLEHMVKQASESDLSSEVVTLASEWTLLNKSSGLGHNLPMKPPRQACLGRHLVDHNNAG